MGCGGWDLRLRGGRSKPIEEIGVDLRLSES